MTPNYSLETSLQSSVDLSSQPDSKIALTINYSLIRSGRLHINISFEIFFSLFLHLL
jgi:hypothetical protein